MKLPERPPFTGSHDYFEILKELKEIDKLKTFTDFIEHDYYYWDKWKYIAQDWKYDSKKTLVCSKNNQSLL